MISILCLKMEVFTSQIVIADCGVRMPTWQDDSLTWFFSQRSLHAGRRSHHFFDVILSMKSLPKVPKLWSSVICMGYQASFGNSLGVLQLSNTEVVVLRRAFDMFMAALGYDREAVGDALYGALTGALLTLKSSFATPKVRLKTDQTVAWRTEKSRNI